MYKWKLSISIPTYKRPEELKRNLNSIMTQAKQCNVGVYVFDDSCSDVNDGVYEEYVNENNFTVVRNEKNVGIDRNILNAAALPDSEYVWLIGEDDRLAKGALEKVLNTLNDCQYDFILPNYVRVKDDLTKTLGGRRVDVYKDITITGEQLFLQYAWAIGFIGGCVIKSDLFARANQEKYLDTYFNHVGMILESMPRDGKVRVLADPLILNRSEGSDSFTWADVAFDVFNGFESMLQRESNNYSGVEISRAIAVARKEFGHYGLKWILSKRADSLYNYEIYKKFISTASISPLNKRLLCVMAFVPSTILKPFQYLLKDVYRNYVGNSVEVFYGVSE